MREKGGRVRFLGEGKKVGGRILIQMESVYIKESTSRFCRLKTVSLLNILDRYLKKRRLKSKIRKKCLIEILRFHRIIESFVSIICTVKFAAYVFKFNKALP